MTLRELLQIVPTLPPALSGIGDYAMFLARELAGRHDVQTRFLNGDLAWAGGLADVSPFPVTAIDERSTAALLGALGETPGRVVLLHYVGYSYARRGCPFWLVRALEEWKVRTHGRLIVLFHEVSGSGPVWTSGFWTSGIQDWLAGKLARLADVRLVTTEIAARRLRRRLPADAVTETLAVFSTLGEPGTPTPRAQRRRQMVVFGGDRWRRAAYTTHLTAFVEACRRLDIERVIDIGVPAGARPALPVPFVEAGALAAREASGLMDQSTAGYFTYPVPHIAKSTIFAVYCAHALTPVTFAENRADGDEGLRAGEHFLAGVSSPGGEAGDAAAVAVSAHAWYQPHRLEIHARKIYQAMMSLPQSEDTPADRP